VGTIPTKSQRANTHTRQQTMMNLPKKSLDKTATDGTHDLPSAKCDDVRRLRNASVPFLLNMCWEQTQNANYLFIASSFLFGSLSLVGTRHHEKVIWIRKCCLTVDATESVFWIGGQKWDLKDEGKFGFECLGKTTARSSTS
jgi:hypothetical protein